MCNPGGRGSSSVNLFEKRKKRVLGPDHVDTGMRKGEKYVNVNFLFWMVYWLTGQRISILMAFSTAMDYFEV